MIYEIISWVGSFLLILSYFLLATNRIKPSNPLYHSINLMGSSLFIMYSLSIGATASVFINSVFAIIALYSVIKISCSK